MNKKIFPFLLSFFIFYLLFFIFSHVQAQIRGEFFQAESIAKWINQVYIWSAGIIGFFAVAAIVIGGIQYMTSLGSEEMITQARQKIFAGITGLILVLLSYTILYTLDPRLVKIGFKVEEVTLPGSGLPDTLTFANPATGKEETLTCETDFGCKTACAGKYGWEKCDKTNVYCRENKTCDLSKAKNIIQGKVVGKPNGEVCKIDSDCQSRLCTLVLPRPWPLEDIKRCNNPLPYDARCEREKDCQSGNCVLNGMDECSRIGGNWEDEDCDTTRDCVPGMFCDDNECACTAGQKWNKETHRCQ